MKERPIRFSDTEVRAILEDRKTQTRRIGKIQSDAFTELGVQSIGHATKGHELQATYRAFPNQGSARWAICECPYGTVGDRLWVREAWAPAEAALPLLPGVLYRADYHTGLKKRDGDHKWKPSIHMKRSDSRITLEITGVRVERLQEISEKDAIAEGVEVFPCMKGLHTDGMCKNAAQECFRKLWDTIYPSQAFRDSPESWSANPWVWVIEFRRVQQ